MKNSIFMPLLACAFLFMSVTCKRPMEKVDTPPLQDIKVPPGFKISIYAEVEDARSLALGDQGTVFVGNRSENSVYALQDLNGDGIAERKYTIVSDMKVPNGVAFYKGALYVAQIDKIWRFDNIESQLTKPPKPVLVYDKLPSDEHHGWKYIAFGPDGKLYVPIGAPCNVCDESAGDKRYSSISRLNSDGSGFEVYAHGIRNTVGFDWHPATSALWFTDNGRDMMGDNLPPDELNVATRKDQHFGFPYCHAGDTPDPQFGKGKNCTDYIAPAGKLTPHGAALGMKFYTGKMFPASYTNQVFIAEHGSWNRTDPIGYRVMLATLNGDSMVKYEPFATGWYRNGKAWGRPVDVLMLKDGSMLISDDFAGLVYRVTYDKK